MADYKATIVENKDKILKGVFYGSFLAFAISVLVCLFSLWKIDTTLSYDDVNNKTKVRDAVNSSKWLGGLLAVVIIFYAIISFMKIIIEYVDFSLLNFLPRTINRYLIYP